MTKEEAKDLLLCATRKTIGEYNDVCVQVCKEFGAEAEQMISTRDFYWAMCIADFKREQEESERQIDVLTEALIDISIPATTWPECKKVANDTLNMYRDKNKSLILKNQGMYFAELDGRPVLVKVFKSIGELKAVIAGSEAIFSLSQFSNWRELTEIRK